MESCAENYLLKLGYKVNSKAFGIINLCDDWYSDREIEDFHVRKNLNNEVIHLIRMNFAKRCCADDANLCEVITVAPDEEETSQDFIDTLLRESSFPTRYREQLEKVTATGTVGAYIYLDDAEYVQDQASGVISVRGGNIRINYCDAENIIPLTVVNGDVTECAFCGTTVQNGQKTTTLVLFRLNESGKYYATTAVFDYSARLIRNEDVILGEVRPFALMKNAEVNNLDDMEGYGLPKIYNAIPTLKVIDLCYSVLFGDMDKADKLVFINEALCEFDAKTGKPKFTSAMKKLFMFLGEKLPDQSSVIQEYNPKIRVDEITKSFELALSLLSMTFGYGTKKYSFENGQIQTATQYIGERQDEMQELNKQRKQASQYICNIIKAALWFSNNFQGTNYDVEEVVNVEFDDSFIEDKQARLEAMRVDAMSFPEIPWLKMEYIKQKYNLSDEEVKKVVEEKIADLEETED